MTRLRIASVLVAALAVSGSWAAPIRTAESTRFVVSIACFAEDDAHEVAIAFTPPDIHAFTLTQSASVVELPAHTSRRLPHALYQRPPPRA